MDRHPLYSLALPLISIGAVGQLAGWLAHWMYPAIGAILGLAGTAMLVVGLAYRAKDKGRSAAWGATGVLSIVGIVIVSKLANRANCTAHN
jgi:hypothetical protein